MGLNLLAVLVRERARPDRIRRWPHAWRLAVATVCLGAFMGQLDASIVTLTYRPVERDFHVGLATVEWISLAYLLTLVALLVPAGRWSDVHGRKLLYLYGFAIFTVASIACALAPSMGVLVVFRVGQAVGAALLQANSVALVATTAPATRLRRALGAQAGAQAVGLALGPTVGGALVSSLGWRWVYLLNVPIGALAILAGIYLLPRTHRRVEGHPLDIFGAGLLTAATAGLLLGVSAASGLSRSGWTAVGLLALAAVSAWAFVERQRRAEYPLLDMDLLADPAVRAGLVGALCGYLVLFGPLVLVPVLLVGHGVSALRAGLILTALPAGFALAATASNRLLPSAWTDGRRARLGATVAVMALAAGLIVPLSPAGLVAILGAVGVGLGIFTPSNNALVMAAIPPARSGTGGGLVNLTRGLGTAVGVSLVTLAMHLGGRPDRGARLAFVVLTAAGAVAALSGWRGGQGRWVSKADRRAARRRAWSTSSSTNAG